jgi:hypothetical protein
MERNGLVLQIISEYIVSTSEYVYQDIMKGITLPLFQGLELSDKAV